MMERRRVCSPVIQSTTSLLEWTALTAILVCCSSRWIDAAAYQQYVWTQCCRPEFKSRQQELPYGQRRVHRRMSAMDDDSIRISEYSFLERIRESLRTENDAYEKEWEDSLRILSELRYSDDTDLPSSLQLEAALATAWNWKRWAIVTSPMARKFIRTVAPNSAAIASSVQWLQQTPLQLTNDIILQGILEAPEAYLLNPQENYAQVLRVAPPEYQDPVAFRALLGRHPAALRCTYNCASTGCNSECGNCWVSFSYQMSEARVASADTFL